MEPLIVDLSLFHENGVGVLAGRPRGERVRRKVGLAAADASERPVTIVIPEWVYSVNSSFSLGLLEDSVVRLGPNEFRQRYTFAGPNADAVKEDVIGKAMLGSSPLRGLL